MTREEDKRKDGKWRANIKEEGKTKMEYKHNEQEEETKTSGEREIKI